MMTVQQVYQAALALLGVQEAQAGDYAVRVIPALNTQLPQLLYAENSLRARVGLDPLQSAPVLGSMQDCIDLQETLVRSVLPYALAGTLVLEEDAPRAAYFQQVCAENLTGFAAACAQPIQDCYR